MNIHVVKNILYFDLFCMRNESVLGKFNDFDTFEHFKMCKLIKFKCFIQIESI